MSGSNDFEIVDSSTVSFVKRGRKSSIDSALVAKLKTLKKGETVLIRKLAQNANDSDYKTVKGRVSAQLRAACREAGMSTYSIRWSSDGVPMIVA